MKIKEKEKINKLIIGGLSFVLMMSIAGYINYKYNPEREKNLGQTVYVSSNNDEVEIYKEDKKQREEKSQMDVYREERENKYLELTNNYSQIINNPNTSNEDISVYQNKLSNLIEEKSQIQILESIIKNKRIDDVVVLTGTSDSNVMVILKAEELSDEMIAQILLQVTETLKVEASNVTIEKIE